MADNNNRGRSADRKRLNKSEPYEVAYAKSDRASPARKAMLGKSAGGAAKKSSGSSAKKSGGAAKRSSGSSAKKSGGAAKKSSGSSAKKSGGAAKKSSRSGARKSASAGRKSASGSGARKSATASGARKSASASGARKSSGAGRGSAQSASPAMKRTNAAPTRPRTPTTRGTPNPPKEERTSENTAPRTMREPDAVDLLTDDHLQVSALFKRYEKLAKKEAPAEERRTLAQAICDMLKAHTAIEEEIFYPAARSAGIEADMLDEAKIEHASAKDLIAQIESGDPDDDLYDARVTVLGEYIQHHVVEEHTEMFPKCRRADMDLVALRGELEARKMSLLPEGADGAMDGAGRTAGEGSPGLLAKLSGKLFSSESGAGARS